MRLLLLLFALTYFACAQTRRRDNPLAKGFPTEIDWVDWSRAIRVAKSRNKPVFFLIHKSWCGACKNLKKEFETDPETPELIELSKKFVMVNVEDDDEPSEKEYRPDGAYIPRIIFLDTNGKHLQTNNAKLFRNHKFFYPLIPQIIDGMKRALDEFETVKRTKREDSQNEAVDEQDTEDKDLEEETLKEAERKKEKKVSEEDDDEGESEEEAEIETSDSKTEEKVEEKKKDKKKEEEKKKKEEEKEKEKKKQEEKKKEEEKKKQEKKKKEEEKKKHEEKKKEEKKKEDKKKEDKTAKKDDKKKKKAEKEDKKDEL